VSPWSFMLCSCLTITSGPSIVHRKCF
jgi:hypothetical protein